jgi:phage antirepressor YoqD-like protein
MSSLEMVSYINSTRKPGEAEVLHKNFMVKVQTVLAEAAAKFSAADIYINGTGGKVQRKVYHFPKREAMLMAMSYSYELQAQIFDAWEAAEASLTKAKTISLIPDFDNPIAAAEAWISEKKAVLSLTNEIAEAQPKIAFHDAVVADETDYSLAEAAKILGWLPRAFNTMLRDAGLLMRNNVAYQYYVGQGVFTLKYNGYLLPDGSTAAATTRVTSKGIAYIQKKMAKESV